MSQVQHSFSAYDTEQHSLSGDDIGKQGFCAYDTVQHSLSRYVSGTPLLLNFCFCTTQLVVMPKTYQSFSVYDTVQHSLSGNVRGTADLLSLRYSIIQLVYLCNRCCASQLNMLLYNTACLGLSQVQHGSSAYDTVKDRFSVNVAGTAWLLSIWYCTTHLIWQCHRYSRASHLMLMYNTASLVIPQVHHGYSVYDSVQHSLSGKVTGTAGLLRLWYCKTQFVWKS